jgi:hypothetical protein
VSYLTRLVAIRCTLAAILAGTRGRTVLSIPRRGGEGLYVPQREATGSRGAAQAGPARAKGGRRGRWRGQSRRKPRAGPPAPKESAAYEFGTEKRLL